MSIYDQINSYVGVLSLSFYIKNNNDIRYQIHYLKRICSLKESNVTGIYFYTEMKSYLFWGLLNLLSFLSRIWNKPLITTVIYHYLYCNFIKKYCKINSKIDINSCQLSSLVGDKNYLGLKVLYTMSMFVLNSEGWKQIFIYFFRRLFVWSFCVSSPCYFDVLDA